MGCLSDGGIRNLILRVKLKTALGTDAARKTPELISTRTAETWLACCAPQENSLHDYSKQDAGNYRNEKIT
ncbi:MAG: hypothetical protein AMXMBFR16_13620 [Candidatus Uhrbacteria bacterium]